MIKMRKILFPLVLGTTTILLPSTTTMTTMDRRSLEWMMAIVAGMLLLVMLAGGTVWLWDEGTTAEGLIVGINPAILRCHPARSVFSGKSTTYFGKREPVETCWQYGNMANYCWSQSWYDDDSDGHPFYLPCHPKPRYGQWRAIEQKNMRYVNPPPDPPGSPYTCGPPCQELFEAYKAE